MAKMANGNIREVVLGFKQMVKGIPSQYDNFEDALDMLFESFYLTMRELLAFKYLAIYEVGYRHEVVIFETEEDRKKWIEEISESCGGTFRHLPYPEFIERYSDELGNPNNYCCEVEGALIFTL